MQINLYKTIKIKKSYVIDLCSDRMKLVNPKSDRCLQL